MNVRGFHERILYGRPDDCWLWQGALGRNGYGSFGDNGRAHRIAWALEYGTIPPGYNVCHRCDVKACVNPRHLFLGTPADNNRDMVRKGRQVTPRGEKNGRAVLTDAQVRAILAEYRKGVPGYGTPSLAKRYGVSGYTIEKIVRRQRWTHIAEMDGEGE